MLQVGISPPGARGRTPAVLCCPNTAPHHFLAVGMAPWPPLWEASPWGDPKAHGAITARKGHRCAPSTGPAPHCTTGQCLACQLPLFLFPHTSIPIHILFLGSLMRDKSSRSYLTSSLGKQHPYPPAGSDQHKEITAQTLPNFYSAQPRGVPPISSGAGGQLRQSRHPWGSQGRTRPPGLCWHAEQGGFACTKPPWCWALSYQTGGKLHPLGGRRLRPL